MSEAEQLRNFLSAYSKYVDEIIRDGEEVLTAELRSLRDPGRWTTILPRGPKRAAPTPICRYKVRIKRPESVVDKIHRKRGSYPNGLSPESIDRMMDVLGGRLVVYFLSDIPAVHQWLTSNERIQLHPEHPPIAYMSNKVLSELGMDGLTKSEKASGYQSVHYVARILDGRSSRETPWFELQVRTLLEDAWSEIEHVLGYKPERRTSFAVTRQFELISDQLLNLDRHFNFVREELQRFQEEASISETDPLNAENLPGVLGEAGIACPQDRVDSLLKILYSRHVETVREFRNLATRENINLIKRLYQAEEGHEPDYFHIVACLVAIHGVSSMQERQACIEAQIEYDRATWDIRRRDEGTPPDEGSEVEDDD